MEGAAPVHMYCKINIKVTSMAQDRFMALDALALMRHSNASWKLLASDDAAFCCAFFYQEFLAGNVRNLPEARLLMDMRPFLKEKHALAKEPQPEEEAFEGGSEAVSAPVVG